MPSFSNVDAFLLVLVVTSSILTLITTTVVAASSATTVGGTDDLSLVRKIKNSKKQGSKNTDEDDACTMEPFEGTSQYTNCAGTEIEVDIACAKKGNAAADGIPTKKSCSYSEQPVQYDDAALEATTAAGCGDHGSFDPETHLTRDHATGMCRLKFLRLTSTCVGAPASSGFGVMVEAPLSTGTGPGAHNHRQPNKDKNPEDNSGLLLRFSYDAGATYYNYEDPRTTVPLDGSSSRRMLFLGLLISIGVEEYVSSDPMFNGFHNGACYPACGTFNGLSNEEFWLMEDDTQYFESCYKYGDEAKFCWTKSYTCFDEAQCPCKPNGHLWKHVYGDVYDEETGLWTCGSPCQGQYESGALARERPYWVE